MSQFSLQELFERWNKSKNINVLSKITHTINYEFGRPLWDHHDIGVQVGGGDRRHDDGCIDNSQAIKTTYSELHVHHQLANRFESRHRVGVAYSARAARVTAFCRSLADILFESFIRVEIRSLKTFNTDKLDECRCESTFRRLESLRRTLEFLRNRFRNYTQYTVYQMDLSAKFKSSYTQWALHKTRLLNRN